MASRTITYQIPADRADGFLEALLGVGATTCSYPGPSMTIDEAKAAAETLTLTDPYRNLRRLAPEFLDGDYVLRFRSNGPFRPDSLFVNGRLGIFAHPDKPDWLATHAEFTPDDVTRNDASTGQPFTIKSWKVSVWYKPGSSPP